VFVVVLVVVPGGGGSVVLVIVLVAGSVVVFVVAALFAVVSSLVVSHATIMTVAAAAAINFQVRAYIQTSYQFQGTCGGVVLVSGVERPLPAAPTRSHARLFQDGTVTLVPTTTMGSEAAQFRALNARFWKR
jgi:hypothetical protein